MSTKGVKGCTPVTQRRAGLGEEGGGCRISQNSDMNMEKLQVYMLVVTISAVYYKRVEGCQAGSKDFGEWQARTLVARKTEEEAAYRYNR